jgi:hypothetical protein
MSDESDIIRALQQGTTAAVAASTNPTLPIKYLEVTFAEPNDGKWLEIVWIPNNRLGDYWGDEKNHQGLFRLILHWPNQGGGIYTPLGIIGSIADYFHKGRALSGVQIYEKPDFTGMVENGDETLFPVSLRYQSYKS